LLAAVGAGLELLVSVVFTGFAISADEATNNVLPITICFIKISESVYLLSTLELYTFLTGSNEFKAQTR
jgi:hypothetical protein